MKRQKIRGLEDWKIGKENSNDKRRWIATQPAVARNDEHSSVIPHFDAVSRSLSSRTERSECERSVVTARSAVIPECLCRESVGRRCRSGFTLVELVIVIAIVIILSVVSVPIYQGYSKRAKMSEGYALLGLLLSSQKNYYSEFGYFFRNKGSYYTGNNYVLGIDARGNKYFTAFNCGDHYNEDTDLKFSFCAQVIKPEALRVDESKSVMILYYNITKGGNIRDDLSTTH